MDLEQQIKLAMQQVAELGDCQLVEPIEASTLLLESGLDSLGYAMLVAQLEEDLGFDPFTELAIDTYPSTFSEFVAIYQQCASQQ
ncbi:phosphopantetheine-binding protein [Paraglaciecola aquimarina]|uniref:Phosphopantetheine-binding protein n=1 Tax=Paraglaciecola aquimarina TaxID=1235557 RepID=A0ABU3T0E8_9ALTE|nr:phosphopantetheine-binding protein [Paraglaciecola aquimarina]MDU0355716.1 phosphopantetheine-binding protein [Paraglaciecola aquimarina]